MMSTRNILEYMYANKYPGELFPMASMHRRYVQIINSCVILTDELPVFPGDWQIVIFRIPMVSLSQLIMIILVRHQRWGMP